ncbi:MULTISPECIES: hypothetical protein [unclassified Sinorhizobium]
MAKGQMMGNREARKQKQKKAPIQALSTFAEQIKIATKSNPQAGKYKK